MTNKAIRLVKLLLAECKKEGFKLNEDHATGLNVWIHEDGQIELEDTVQKFSIKGAI